MTFTGNQLAAARVLSGQNREDLAQAAHVDPEVIEKLEARGAEHLRREAPEVRACMRALERAGIEFLFDGGIGLRYRRPGKRDEGLRPCDLDATNDD